MADSKKVTRIKAKDDAPRSPKASQAVPAKRATKKTVAAKKPKQAVVTTDDQVEVRKNVFARIGGYFKGAWVELRQVRWPNRKATWALTLAVIIFSAFFVGLILLLDTFFQYIFKLIIG